MPSIFLFSETVEEIEQNREEKIERLNKLVKKRIIDANERILREYEMLFKKKQKQGKLEEALEAKKKIEQIKETNERIKNYEAGMPKNEEEDAAAIEVEKKGPQKEKANKKSDENPGSSGLFDLNIPGENVDNAVKKQPEGPEDNIIGTKWRVGKNYSFEFAEDGKLKTSSGQSVNWKLEKETSGGFVVRLTSKSGDTLLFIHKSLKAARGRRLIDNKKFTARRIK